MNRNNKQLGRFLRRATATVGSVGIAAGCASEPAMPQLSTTIPQGAVSQGYRTLADAAPLSDAELLKLAARVGGDVSAVDQPTVERQTARVLALRTAGYAVVPMLTPKGVLEVDIYTNLALSYTTGAYHETLGIPQDTRVIVSPEMDGKSLVVVKFPQDGSEQVYATRTSKKWYPTLRTIYVQALTGLEGLPYLLGIEDDNLAQLAPGVRETGLAQLANLLGLHRMDGRKFTATGRVPVYALKDANGVLFFTDIDDSDGTVAFVYSMRAERDGRRERWHTTVLVRAYGVADDSSTPRVNESNDPNDVFGARDPVGEYGSIGMTTEHYIGIGARSAAPEDVVRVYRFAPKAVAETWVAKVLELGRDLREANLTDLGTTPEIGSAVDFPP